MHFVLATGDSPGPAVQLLLRLQSNSQLSPMWNTGELYDGIITGRRKMSAFICVLRNSLTTVFFTGLPFFKAA